MRCMASVLACTAFAWTCSAQTPQGGWTIQVIGGPVTPSNPAVTVRVLASFDPSFHAFAGGDLDMMGVPTGAFRGPVLLPVHVPPSPQPAGTTPGTPSGGDVIGIVTGQIFLGIFQPSLDNPIALWEATWITDNFTPRSVALETAGTTLFFVYDRIGQPIQLHPHAFAPGSAEIKVVPAPAAAALLLAAALIGCQRPRRIADEMEDPDSK
jgi:hypothetical protein